MADALVPLYSTTLTAATTSVTISGISNTYRDLRLVIQGTSSTASGLLWIINGDATGTNYSNVYILGDGATASSGTATSNSWSSIRGANLTQYEASVMDYSATDKHKSVLVRQGDAVTAGSLALVGRWASTAAVTSIQLSLGAATFSIGTTFSLYGIVG